MKLSLAATAATLSQLLFALMALNVQADGGKKGRMSMLNMSMTAGGKKGGGKKGMSMSMSLVPSAAPSSSLAPSVSASPSTSMAPSVSISPSSSPSTSMAPSVSSSPSMAPSASPTTSMAPSVSSSPSASPSTSMAPSESSSPSSSPTSCAGVIRGPMSAQVLEGGTRFGPIVDTINQNGLRADYDNGVTDFDSFTELHNPAAVNNEWFSVMTEATVLYDMGAEYVVEALALWHEDAQVDMRMDVVLSSSLDGTTFTLVDSFTPQSNTLGQVYPREVFEFPSPVVARYFRYEMTDCFASAGGDDILEECSIGEVAFKTCG